MKKFAILLSLTLGLSIIRTASAQFPANPNYILVVSAPGGSCTGANPAEQVISTGTIWTCQSGSWAQITASGGPPTGAAGGKLSGTYPNPNVADLSGVTNATIPVAVSAPSVTTPTVNGNALPGITPVSLNTTLGAGSAYSVWQRQGAVINLTGQMDSEPSVILDTNPVILTSYTQVFKMLFSHETGANSGTWYAESATGAPGTWSIYTGGPSGSGYVLPGRGNFLLKNGSTYYAWTLNGISCPATLSVYTSTDGVTWGSGSSALTCSGTETGLGNISIISDPLTTNQWDMILEDVASGCNSGVVYCLNVLTLSASTPVGTWSRYSGNPIILNGSGPAGPFYNSGTSTWWLWGHSGSPDSDLGRWEASSLTGSWTKNPTWSNFPRITAAEYAQVADPTLVQVAAPVNGISAGIYMFYSAGVTTSSGQTIEEAIAPNQTLATLETSPETTASVPGDVVLTPAQDSNVTPNNLYSVAITKADGKTPVFEVDTGNLVTRVENELLLNQSSGTASTPFTIDFSSAGSSGGSFTANWRNQVLTVPFNGAQNGFHINNGTNDLFYLDSAANGLWVYNGGTNGNYSLINLTPPGNISVTPGGTSGNGQIKSNWREFTVTIPYTGSGHGYHVNNGTSDIFFLDSGSNLGQLAGIQSTGTKFTTSGCSVSSTAGGATAGKMTLGANTCSVVITMAGATGAAATNGWSCRANDETTALGNPVYESGSNTTTATLVVSATAGSTDVIDFSCTAF